MATLVFTVVIEPSPFYFVNYIYWLIQFINLFWFNLKNGGAKDGLDMNIAPAWQKGYTGKGVVVSILDDGIQTNHPDLAQNYVRNLQLYSTI